MKISEKLKALDEKTQRLARIDGEGVFVLWCTDVCGPEVSQWHIGIINQNDLFNNGLHFKTLEAFSYDELSLSRAIDGLSDQISERLLEEAKEKTAVVELHSSYLHKRIVIGGKMYQLKEV